MVQKLSRAAEGREKFFGPFVGGLGEAPPEKFEN